MSCVTAMDRAKDLASDCATGAENSPPAEASMNEEQAASLSSCHYYALACQPVNCANGCKVYKSHTGQAQELLAGLHKGEESPVVSAAALAEETAVAEFPLAIACTDFGQLVSLTWKDSFSSKKAYRD